MSPELVGIIFTGIGGLVAALSTFSANRSRQTAADVKALRVRVRRLERRDVANAQHMFTLESAIVKLGGDVPQRPAILEEPLTEDVDD